MLTEPARAASSLSRSVFHPSDFSKASENAFAHALAIALRGSGKFTILHAAAEDFSDRSWSLFPGVRETLERWGVIEKDSPRSAVAKELGLKVRKINSRGKNPLTASLAYLEKSDTDLIVLSTERRQGLPRWIRPSLAEQLARRAGTRSLFVPKGANGFVSADTGEVILRRILVPLDHRPDPAEAVEAAERAAGLAEGEPVEIQLLHVGDPAERPRIATPVGSNCRWSESQREGEIVPQIAEAAEAFDADLIVMTSAGHDGILDALRGSVTEQVLRCSPCALLAVPATA